MSAQKRGMAMEKILVVEDDAPSLILTTEVLKNYNYLVVSAVDGEEAIEVAERENPDLAILDVMLPGLNGFQVCERLRSMPQFRNMPILMLTVLNEDSHQLRAIEAGANGFLTKPFKHTELIMRIKALLSVSGNVSEMVSINTAISALLTALELRRPGSTMSSRRCANLAEHLATVSGVSDEVTKSLRRGVLLRDIGFIACNDEVALTDDHDPTSREHALLGLKIISGFGNEIVEAIVRFHHSTLNSSDYPSHLPPDVKKCVNIALVCNRFEELIYGSEPHSKKDALRIIQSETDNGIWPHEEVGLLTRLLAS